MKKHFLNFSIYLLWEKDSSLLLTNSVLDFSLKPLTLFLFFIYASSFGQEKTHTFPNATNTTTLYVPAGVVEMDVEAWGAGGAGGANLDGRSGGGGGGGAYAKRKITVSPNVNLTMSAAPATTTSSANGGNSTIVGYESLIFAKGGTGGGSNNAGVAPSGGSGGLDSDSFGTEKASGVDGLQGHVGLINLLFISGAGGKGGGVNGGAGGPRAESVALGNFNGNPGTAPGGGGSGGMNALLGAARSGGAGGEGRIIAKYTCIVYSITSVETLPVCASNGNAQITLRSTTTNLLPAGVYNVTYTLTNPAATVTTSMTVSAAGTGTFTISGLTTAGTRGITINKLDSGDCTSGTITTGNTASIVISAASAGGTVSGGTTICSGATSGSLSLASSFGSVLRWESSVSPFSSWTSIPATIGLTTYTSGALTETTRFRAVVKNGSCDEIGSVYTTVTVNPIPQGNLTASSSFCGSGAGMLTWTSTGTVNGPYTIVYKENGGADRTATNVASGTPFAVATTPVNVTTTYTLVSITGSNSCPRTTGFTNNSATITINPLPQGSLTANGPFCETGAGLLTWNATGTATGPFTIVYKENGGADRTATGVVSGTAFSPFTTSVNTTTTYTLVSVTGSNSCPRTNGFTSNSATITINALPQGSLTASSSFCDSGAGQLTWTATGTATGPFTIVYKENGGADRTATNVASGTPFAVATTPVNVTTTYTLVSVTGSNSCPRTTGFTGNSATITINPLPQGSLTANGPFCSTGAGLLTWNATGTATGPYTIVYKENGGANRTASGVVSGTAFSTFTTPVTTTTTYTLVSVTGSNSCPRTTGFTSGTATITINQGSAAPVVGTIVNPTCTVATGSVVLNGLTGPGNILQDNGTTVVSVPFSGTSVTISGLAFGTYRFAVENSCSTTYTSNVVIQPNIWNGTSWSYGTTDPSLDDIVEFRGNYALNRNINACSCTVLSGFTVGVQTEKTLTVVKGVHVETGASLIFADGSNLMQTSNDNNLNTGNIIYKRNSTPIRQADFVYWSSPVKSQSLYNVSPLTEDDKYYTYDGLQWIGLSSSALMIAGKGYFIRGPDTFSNTTRQAFSATFVGVPHNGNITGEATVTNRGYLIGNPYPSALSADDFINGNSVVGGTLYFWTHNTPVVLGGYYRYSSDDYASYNLTGGVGTGTAAKSGTNPDPDNNRSVPSGYIAAGQSFFAQAIGTGNIVFNNLMRRGGNLNSQFFKTSQEAKTTDIEKNRVWINMTNTEGAFKQILVGYIEGATNDYDRKYDGISFDGNKYLDFYSVNKTAKLVIQGRALPFKNTDIVPLGYRTTVAGEFTIGLDHADGNLTIQPIFLEDKTTGIIHNLRSGNYTFTTETGTFADRFVLVYTDKTLGTDDFENPDNTIYVSVKDKIIRVDSGNEPIREVSVYSVNGSLVYTKKLVNATELRIPELLVKSQVLLVKVTLENNNVTTKKIIY